MSNFEIVRLLINIGMSSTALPLFLCTYIYIKKELNEDLTYIFYLLLASSVGNILEFLLPKYGYSNLFVSDVYRVIEFILITAFFWKISLTKKSYLIKIISVAWFLFLCSYPLIMQGTITYGGFMRVITAAFVIYYTCSYLYHSYDLEIEIEFSKSPLFFILASFMIYYGTSFFAFLFSDYILYGKNNQLLILTFGFHSIAQILFNLINTYAFYLYLVNKKEPNT